jgi:hypothetical protein
VDEKENIKRVCRWLLLDRQIRVVDVPIPEETIKKWKKEYLWVIDYLEEKSAGKKNE